MGLFESEYAVRFVSASPVESYGRKEFKPMQCCSLEGVNISAQDLRLCFCRV